jgi:N-terminal acetyltransferase B complex non-catalytic subunit
MNDLLEQYFEAVGDKACCFEDLKPYIIILEGAQQERWTAFLKNVPVSFVRAIICSMATIDRLAGDQK